MSASLQAIVEYLDQELDHVSVSDYPGARNGLHLENSGQIDHLFAAVDANILTLGNAAATPSSLLVVHHGLTWNGLTPLTGGRYRMIKQALTSDLAVYSSHLPLDAHPEYGNNALLTRLLGFKTSTPFLEIKGTLLSRLVEVQMDRDKLTACVASALGGAQLIAGGPQTTGRIIVSTGSGNSLLKECRMC